MTPEERNAMSDHDLLICIDVKQSEFGKQLSNHLKHHWAVNLTLLSALLITCGSLLVVLLTH
jgi:hypothetical protein